MSPNIADIILSREDYIAAYKSNEFSEYRERILSESLRFHKSRLFPTQLEILRKRLETSLQELVNATPNDTEILERDFGLTIKELVMKNHFDDSFQRLKENVDAIVSSVVVNSITLPISARL